MSRGEVTDGTLSGERAYGAVAAVEYLTQQTDEALVKESFEAINAGTSDGLAPIDDALALHDWSLEGLIDDLWWAMYTMCDGAEMWSPFGWCNDPWFPVTASGPGTSQTKRPAHETVWLASQPAGSRTFSAHRYGAAFIDFVLASVPDNAYGTSVVLEFDASQVTTDDWVQVVAWKDTPGGELCQTRRMSYPASGGDKTAIAVEIPTGCSYATLVAVNKHTGTGTEAAAFPVSWSTFQSGAVIGNGTVTLGVNADGSLGLGPSHPMPCRGVPAVVAREGSTELGVGPAFVLDVTGHDAIRENDPCGGRPTQGWSLVDPSEVPGGQPSTWSKHGLDYPEAYPVPVASFTSTSTEATSVVRLDGKYTLTQHWHPSSVDPRMYQLDVTIRLATLQPPWTPDPPQLTYRQVVPLNIGRWNSSDHVAAVRGVGDGVTDTTTNLYWSWDPELEPDPGSIDDPLVPLPPSNCDNRHCLGFALDITINSPSVTPPPSPQISIVYGFADSATEAASLLDTAGATTYAIAQTTDWDENTSALVVGYRSTP